MSGGIAPFVSNALARIFSRDGSRFRRNFLSVVRANVLAQAFSVIAAPLLTRLYTPADYGAIAIFASLSSILLAFVTLRFEWSVPNATSGTQAAALLVIGALSLGFCSATAFLALWLCGACWPSWHGLNVLRPYLLALPIAIVGGGLHQLIQAWFVREANLAAVSRTRVVQAASGTALNVAGGVLQLGSWGMIGSSVISAWVGLGALVRRASGLNSGLARLSCVKLSATWGRYRGESAFSTLVSVLNAASLAATPLILAQFYTPTEVGWYAVMLRLAVAPVGIFTAALGQSFWAEAAQLVDTDRAALKRLYLRSSQRMALLAAPIAVVCLFGPLYTGVVLGAEWTRAGYLLAALSPMILGQILVSPLSHLIVHRKQHWNFLWDSSRLALLGATLISAGTGGQPIELAVVLGSLVMASMYGLLFMLNLLALGSQA